MRQNKAIFVTILVSMMLAAIDACLYILYNPAFVVLTGAVVAYGLLRGAFDFCHWLSKPDPEPKHLTKKVAPTEAPAADGVYDWADDEELADDSPTVRDNGRDAAIMRVLDENV